MLGTQYPQSHEVTWLGLWLAIGIGAMSAAVNLANNIRDIPSDAQTGKTTLAVRLGDAHSRQLFTALLVAPFILTIFAAFTAWPALFALVYAPFAVGAVRIVNRGAQGKELIPVLARTGRAMLIWAVVMLAALTFFDQLYWVA